MKPLAAKSHMDGCKEIEKRWRDSASLYCATEENKVHAGFMRAAGNNMPVS